MSREVFAGAVLVVLLSGGAFLAVRRAQSSGRSAAPLPVASAHVKAAARAASAPSSSAHGARGPDTSVWKVPVYADDPCKGPADALVTLVAFADFQSPPAKRAAKTLEQLLLEYPNELRIVWKDDPAPFNARAKSAAFFARLVYNLQGQRGFWQAHDLLFDSQPKLEDADLEVIARKLNVVWSSVKPVLAASPVMTKIDQSIELARDVEARGMPHFFINGVRLPGAQPIAKFRRRVEQALAEAKALVASGISRSALYDRIVKEGKQLPVPETRNIPPLSAPRPSLGPDNAKVAIQYWSEFPCPSCARVMFLLYELQQEYPSELKIVWRHTADPSRKEAFLAARGAHEAFAQKGSAAFWTFHNRLLEIQGAPDGLAQTTLETLARDTALDVERFKSALHANTHSPQVTADAKVAQAAGISTTPSFTINGYTLTGSPDPSDFRRAIQRALREAGGR